jgi:hypothetical protein
MPDVVALRFGAVLTAAFPLSATAALTFNPDAYTASDVGRSR